MEPTSTRVAASPKNDPMKSWASANHLRQVDVSPKWCAHVLRPRGWCHRYYMRPDAQCKQRPTIGFDHAHVWRRPDGSRFILAHEYADDTPKFRATLARIASEIGLRVTVGDPTDAWYSASTTPVRWELPS